MQELLGHADVSTTMIYTHVLKVAGGVQSPLDALAGASLSTALERTTLRQVDEMTLCGE